MRPSKFTADSKPASLSQCNPTTSEREKTFSWRRPVLILYTSLACIAIFVGLAWSLPEHGEYKDLGSFVASGRAATEGKNPYAPHPLTYRINYNGEELYNVNLNPPVTVNVFTVLANVNVDFLFEIWYRLSMLLYSLTILILIRTYPRNDSPKNSWRILWALGFAGFWHALEVGQVYVILGFACMVAWLFLDESCSVLAGFVIGFVVALKPNFVIWPILLLVSGRWRAATTSFAVAGALGLIPLATYGPRIYVQWLEAASSHVAVASSFPTNISLNGMSTRLGFPLIGAFSTTLLVLVAIMLARQKSLSISQLNTIALATILLVSPIAWIGYGLVLLPVIFARRWTPLFAAAAALFLVPVPISTWLSSISSLDPLTTVTVYSWAILLLYIDVLRGSPIMALDFSSFYDFESIYDLRRSQRRNIK